MPRCSTMRVKSVGLLAAVAPTLDQAIAVAVGKAYVILDGTLLRIDRVGMASGADRGFYSGKQKCHGVNVQVIADPIGRLVWISPVLLGPATTWAPPASTGSSTRSTLLGSPRSPTPPTRAAGPPSEPHSGGAVSTPTPAATGACRATRRPSTPRTPVNADRVSGWRPGWGWSGSCAGCASSSGRSVLDVGWLRADQAQDDRPLAEGLVDEVYSYLVQQREPPDAYQPDAKVPVDVAGCSTQAPRAEFASSRSYDDPRGCPSRRI